MKSNLCCTVNPYAPCSMCGGALCKLHYDTSSRCLCIICVMKWANKAIKDAIITNGEYSHNICSNALRAVTRASNYKTANMLVDKYKLTKRYKIPKMYGDA